MAAREIRWTITATIDKISIYEYWTDRNQSTLYAEKLEILFNEAMKIASIFPFSGLKTDILDVRLHIVRDFKLVYRVRDEYIEVLRVWGTQKDPRDFNLE